MKKNIQFFNILTFILLCFSLLWGSAHTGKAQTGTDWSIPVNVSASGIAANPISVVDFNGIVHVLWVDEIDGYRYTRSTRRGTWTRPITVKFPFDVKDSPPVLVADPSGFIHVFWLDKTGEFHYAQSLSENFGDPKYWVFATLSNSVSSFDAIVDTNGMMHLAYIENITNEDDIAGVYYRQSRAGSGSWSSPVSLYKSEYFRGSSSTSASVRVAASNQAIGQTLYITWDNRPQKRIFVSASVDAGKTWTEAQQFKGPEDTGGYDSPFNFSAWAKDQNILFMWQVGTPGASKCGVYSQWSQDKGKSFGDVIQLFGGSTTCPSSIKFVSSKEDKVAVLLNAPSSPTLLAWNGTIWSDPQLQIDLPALINPDTYDPIFLGCRQDLFFNDTLFVIGCDQAGDVGDIWYISRPLVPLDEWFSPISIWSEPISVEVEEQSISAPASAVDADGSMHIVWAQSPATKDGAKPSIQYSRWNGNDWSTPEAVIWNLDGVPLQLTMYVDSQNRLMLAWVDGSTGDLLYSWANADQANQASGWETSVILPSPSTSNSAPDLVVDSLGRIVVAYAVPFNENRGIYITQSTDNGVSWSSYSVAFDAAAAQWESIDSPQIALDGDGVLHLLFTRQSRWSSQLVGMYYSQSKDGGVTWSDPQPVTDGKIYWSDIITYDQHTVLRVWQEENGLVFANLAQLSQDGGLTWGKLQDVTGVSDQPSSVALATNGINLVHFIQIAKTPSTGLATQEALFIYDSKWDGTAWRPTPVREFRISGRNVQYAVTAAITTQNYLGVFLAVESSDPNGMIKDEMISLSRFLELATEQEGVISSVLPTTVPAVIGQPAALEYTPTPAIDLSVLYESNNPSEGITKNLVGLILIGVVLMVVVILFARRKPQNKIEREDS